ncbi:hypothetical protein JR316_0011145 [Psilocybe cubensis]|uniref:Uncharacterized protein n=2 Tax=Psilocybe cubensis TaxID=181762 RepID=A0ACB8GNT9_PSICU|nr:hypothetical protein JR316_0011145 [Psilocybe cubensis]KAH9477226.1 hypothetical protein JR316_0011145 [Psilocybe cubensis]
MVFILQKLAFSASSNTNVKSKHGSTMDKLVAPTPNHRQAFPPQGLDEYTVQGSAMLTDHPVNLFPLYQNSDISSYTEDVASGFILPPDYTREHTITSYLNSVCDMDIATKAPCEPPNRHTPIDPDSYSLIMTLADTYMVHSARTGSLDDIDAAIAHYQRVLGMLTPEHESKDVVLDSLSIAFQKRYDLSGEYRDVHRAVMCLREAMRLCPNGHPERGRRERRLKNALPVRYEKMHTMLR